MLLCVLQLCLHSLLVTHEPAVSAVQALVSAAPSSDESRAPDVEAPLDQNNDSEEDDDDDTTDDGDHAPASMHQPRAYRFDRFTAIDLTLPSLAIPPPTPPPEASR